MRGALRPAGGRRIHQRQRLPAGGLPCSAFGYAGRPSARGGSCRAPARRGTRCEIGFSGPSAGRPSGGCNCTLPARGPARLFLERCASTVLAFELLQKAQRLPTHDALPLCSSGRLNQPNSLLRVILGDATAGGRNDGVRFRKSVRPLEVIEHPSRFHIAGVQTNGLAKMRQCGILRALLREGLRHTPTSASVVRIDAPGYVKGNLKAVYGFGQVTARQSVIPGVDPELGAFGLHVNPVFDGVLTP